MESILKKYDDSLDHIFSKIPDNEYDELVGDDEDDDEEEEDYRGGEKGIDGGKKIDAEKDYDSEELREYEKERERKKLVSEEQHKGAVSVPSIPVKRRVLPKTPTSTGVDKEDSNAKGMLLQNEQFKAVKEGKRGNITKTGAGKKGDSVSLSNIMPTRVALGAGESINKEAEEKSGKGDKKAGGICVSQKRQEPVTANKKATSNIRERQEDCGGLEEEEDEDEDVGAAAFRRRYNILENVPDILRRAARKPTNAGTNSKDSSSPKTNATVLVKGASDNSTGHSQTFQELAMEKKMRQQLLKERHTSSKKLSPSLQQQHHKMHEQLPFNVDLTASRKGQMGKDVSSKESKTSSPYLVMGLSQSEEEKKKEEEIKASIEKRDQELSSYLGGDYIEEAEEEKIEEESDAVIPYGYSSKGHKFQSQKMVEEEQEKKEEVTESELAISVHPTKSMLNKQRGKDIMFSAIKEEQPHEVVEESREDDAKISRPCQEKAEEQMPRESPSVTEQKFEMSEQLSVAESSSVSNSAKIPNGLWESPLTAENDGGVHSHSRVGQQAELIGTMKSRLDERASEIKKLLKQNESILLEKQKVEDELESEKSRVRVMERRFGEINYNHEELISIKDEYKKRNSQFLEELHNLRQENARLISTDSQKTISELHSKIDFYKMKQGRGEEAQMQLKLEQEEVKHQKALVQESQEEVERLRSKLKKTQEELLKTKEDSEYEYRKLKMEIKDLKQRLDATSMVNNGEKNRMETLQREISTLRTDNNQLSQEIRTRREEVKRLETKLDSQQMKLVQTDNKLHDFKASFEAKCAAKVREQSATLQRKVSEADEKVRKLKLEYEAFKKHSNDMLESEKKLTAKLKRMQIGASLGTRSSTVSAATSRPLSGKSCK
eukprot:Nk52_evm41s2579 gene=Nk52_evmTU41s2579